MEISLDQEERSWNLIVRIVKNYRFPDKKKKPISIQNRIQTGFHDGSSLLIFSTELATNLVTVHKILRLLRESS